MLLAVSYESIPDSECLSNQLLVYRPNLKMKSDADIIRDAKLEAMGLLPEDHEYRRPQHDRTQMATDELVCIMLLPVPSHLRFFAGYGAFQEENEEIVTAALSPYYADVAL